MVRDFVGFNSKDSVCKKEVLDPVPMMLNNPFFRPVFSGAPWHGSTGASVPGQLTIFYDGMVNVYDGISPEKAQVIMFLAGNGHFVAKDDTPQTRTQAKGPTPMTPISTQPCSPVSSPMSVSSHHVGQLTGGPSNEAEAAQRIISSLEQGMQSAIPQARKASLARFLEKRKESKKAMDCSSNAVVAREEN